MGEKWKVACADGFEVVSADQKELVALVQWHGQHSHQKHLSESDTSSGWPSRRNRPRGVVRSNPFRPDFSIEPPARRDRALREGRAGL